MIKKMMHRRIFFLLIFLLPSISHAVSLIAAPFSANPNVKVFIHYMVVTHHFNEADLTKLFDTVKLKPSVTQSVKAPLERKTWPSYQAMFVTNQRIEQGVRFWQDNRETLEKATRIYGVPASIIVATMGMETRYGQNRGGTPVLDSLSTLAFDNTTRTAFFRRELEEFLLLTREQHVDPRSIVGSYAGAIGQPQFMPSSYRNFAVNFSGNPSIDLSHNVADVIGSIANYYHKNGWVANELIAIPLSLSGGRYQLSIERRKPLSWSEVVAPGTPIDADAVNNAKNKLLILRNYFHNEYWVCLPNFRVIKRYNHSDLYAMAVFELSVLIEKRYQALGHSVN